MMQERSRLSALGPRLAVYNGESRVVDSGFSLATFEDDRELRALLGRSAMAGAVRVAFTREPDYFAGEGLGGAQDVTLVHRDHGRVDGVGRLSVHTLHRNGEPRRIGYLGELRLDAGVRRGARLLRDGYALLREHAFMAELDCCFTSIAADNERARRVLEHGGRLGLPTYTPLTDLVTLLLPVGRPARAAPPDRSVDRDELTAFLRRHARTAQLTLTWDDARWAALARHGVDWRDFRVVRERPDGPIVAAGAVWDQRAFRQVVVHGYEGPLRWMRPAINLLSRTGAVPPLPAPGTAIAQGMILGASADDARHRAPLVEALRGDAARRGLDWLAIARDAHDPQLDALRRLGRPREYRTRLYDVRWLDGPRRTEPWDALPFRPEVALL